MDKTERRRRTALDEAYRYFNKIESGEEAADLYQLTKAVRTLSFALAFSDTGEFKLTRQLWKRLHQALFDKLVTGFAGRISVLDENEKELEVRSRFPESGVLQFLPEGCKRQDDLMEIEISRLYPKTLNALKHVFETRSVFTKPEDFQGAECDGGVCFMKPMVTGHEVMGEESLKGRNDAHHRYWVLYWEAYCTVKRKDQEIIMRHMSELEEVWGNLYY